jgi:hypothetical protein
MISHLRAVSAEQQWAACALACAEALNADIFRGAFGTNLFANDWLKGGGLDRVGIAHFLDLGRRTMLIEILGPSIK